MQLIEFVLCHYHTCCMPIHIPNWFRLFHFPIVLCCIGAKDKSQMQNRCVYVILLILAESDQNAARLIISDLSDVPMQRL